jgi:DNA-binding HxlR family transcriptional regulator
MVQKKIHAVQSSCPVAYALDIVGDHWTLLIIRDLMFLGLHEYKEILAGSEGISTNILTDRLKKMTQNGLISSVFHPEDRKRKLYFLTNKGKDLVETMVYLIRWSERYHSDHLEIPPEIRKLIVNSPSQYIELTLLQLKKWEEKNLQHG